MEEWQLWIALLSVALATIYLLRVGWRTFRGRSKGCSGGNCGCVRPSDPLILKADITLRPNQPRLK